jgi:hypothetical protein
MPAGPGDIAVGDLRVITLGPTIAASINEPGEIAYAGDGSAIVLVAAGQETVLVRAGDPAPCGGRYAGFRELDLGEAGHLLFRATLTGGGEGLFLRTPAGVQPIARDACFSQLTMTATHIAYAVRQSLVIWNLSAAPRTVLTAGAEVAGGTLGRFAISRLGAALCCVADVDHQRIALVLTEGQIIWGDRVREGGRFPHDSPISRLLTPPAAYADIGFVAAEFADGSSGLVSRPTNAEPRVFARSGDPAPGLPDASIERFGPPVANSGGVPDNGPCGIVSVVRLTSGDTALWVGTVHRPAAIPLVAGDSTDDDPSLVVESFTPVKLTNSGSLLLRAGLRTGGTVREGLLVLYRLFDWP